MYYNKNDYRNYLTNDDSLCHYGVLGMKWGVHKAKSIDRDIAMNTLYNRNASNKHAYKSGSINRETYVMNKRKNKQKFRDENNFINKEKYKNITAGNNKSVKSIYEKSEKKANELMPNYTRNKRIRNALGAASMAGGFVGGNLIGRGMSANMLAKHVGNLKTRAGSTYDPTINALKKAANVYYRAGVPTSLASFAGAATSDAIQYRNTHRRRKK